MRKIKPLAVVAALALSTLMLTACAKSDFRGTVNSDERITITAENAEKGDAFTVGTLEVEEGEKVVVTSNLTTGVVKVEVIEAPEEGVGEMPTTDGEVILSGDLKPSEGMSGGMAAGDYLVRATCLEKATGDISVVVEPEL